MDLAIIRIIFIATMAVAGYFLTPFGLRPWPACAAGVAIGLAIVLAMIFGIAWLVRRVGPLTGAAGAPLKIVASHGGGGICETISRMDYAYELQDEAFFLGSYAPMKIKHKPSHYLKMMYLESTCYHPPGARCAIDTVGIDHFLFGTDSPPLFVLKREGVDLINKLGLTPEEKNKVYYENAKKLLKL